MAKKEKVTVALHCKKCNRFNYTVKRSPKAAKLDGISRFCRGCNNHQPHVQKKIPKPQ
ncbi:50S ribosomal protein L33 [candidate division WWE3 bacterium]|nr:50S ribosomal protein L33 [candidate division WWE3 bacterium]